MKSIIGSVVKRMLMIILISDGCLLLGLLNSRWLSS